MDKLFLFIKSEEKQDENKEQEDKKVEINKKNNQNKYNRTFYDRHKEKINSKIICDVCCGSYSYFNKSKHLKCQKHLRLLNKKD